MNRRLVVLSAIITVISTVFGWGSGHDTVARETLRVLPGVWGERLRSGEEGKLFVHSCHAPDDQSTKLVERSQYLDEELIAALDGHNGKPVVMYRFHASQARCELIRALARAIKRGDAKSIAFLLACFNHSVADTVSANHAPLTQLVSYNWCRLGLKNVPNTECTILEKTAEGRKIMTETIDAVDKTLADVTPDSVWAACFADETNGTDYNRYDVDFVEGGKSALDSFAAEVAYPVRRTIEALLAAEAFAKLPEVPRFDMARESKRAQEAAHAFLAKRSIHDDSITRGLVPEAGKVPETGVIYDPLGFWTRGIVYTANKTLAAQICTSLKKRHNAGLLDIREIAKTGVPAGVKTVVFPASGFGSFQGFQAKDVSDAILKFLSNGGKLVWVGGSPAPAKEIFPEATQFTKNPASNPWGHMRGPVAAVDMPGGALLLPNGKTFVCKRAPAGSAGWYWDQLGYNFMVPNELPADAKEVLAFRTKDGVRSCVGYAIGKRIFLPAFSLYPFVFTDEKPQVKPLKLELDSAGEAIIESVVN